MFLLTTVEHLAFGYDSGHLRGRRAARLGRCGGCCRSSSRVRSAAWPGTCSAGTSPGGPTWTRPAPVRRRRARGSAAASAPPSSRSSSSAWGCRWAAKPRPKLMGAAFGSLVGRWADLLDGAAAAVRRLRRRCGLLPSSTTCRSAVPRALRRSCSARWRCPVVLPALGGSAESYRRRRVFLGHVGFGLMLPMTRCPVVLATAVAARRLDGYSIYSARLSSNQSQSPHDRSRDRRGPVDGHRGRVVPGGRARKLVAHRRDVHGDRPRGGAARPRGRDPARPAAAVVAGRGAAVPRGGRAGRADRAALPGARRAAATARSALRRGAGGVRRGPAGPRAGARRATPLPDERGRPLHRRAAGARPDRRHRAAPARARRPRHRRRVEPAPGPLPLHVPDP